MLGPACARCQQSSWPISLPSSRMQTARHEKFVRSPVMGPAGIPADCQCLKSASMTRRVSSTLGLVRSVAPDLV